MIRRGPRPVDNFVMVSNAALEDVTLSWRARGVLAYLLSRPEGWSSSAERLATLSPGGAEGRGAMRAALSELAARGYLKREKTQDSRGRWGTSQVVYDTPQDVPTAEEKPAKKRRSAPEPAAIAAATAPEQPILDDSKNRRSPVVGEPDVGSPDVGGPVPINKTDTKTERKTESSKTEREALRWYPSVEYRNILATRHQGLALFDVRDMTAQYLDEMDRKKWRYTDEGWLKHIEWTLTDRARRNRGRTHAPNGVPL